MFQNMGKKSASVDLQHREEGTRRWRSGRNRKQQKGLQHRSKLARDQVRLRLAVHAVWCQANKGGRANPRWWCLQYQARRETRYSSADSRKGDANSDDAYWHGTEGKQQF
ncbi:hypothetical protein ZHAS_00003695 [Anopheles sinensis]|uniref:Uncharacterized protein n=1 Tax=Anopheles sinensis TaxID=74873 RepID=A0A084VF96_ANOSI|nr:hypothetical protein ZHAS_00003695 [Anopheles sinensis]